MAHSRILTASLAVAAAIVFVDQRVADASTHRAAWRVAGVEHASDRCLAADDDAEFACSADCSEVRTNVSPNQITWAHGNQVRRGDRATAAKSRQPAFSSAVKRADAQS